MNLFNLIRIKIRRQRNVVIRIDDWRRNKGLVEASRTFLLSRSGQVLLDMLQNESPMELSTPEIGVSSDDRAFRLAKIEGYQLCLRRLALSAVPDTQPDEPLVETFEPPEMKSE